ncbi:hypothetical protein B0H14DRAFT_2568783 [Mycena olivaceomarginata]|nr:hypothetical protein B0H14DRAFT_2568783 [Mycena olivaceomarginata]
MQPSAWMTLSPGVCSTVSNAASSSQIRKSCCSDSAPALEPSLRSAPAEASGAGDATRYRDDDMVCSGVARLRYHSRWTHRWANNECGGERGVRAACGGGSLEVSPYMRQWGALSSGRACDIVMTRAVENEAYSGGALVTDLDVVLGEVRTAVEKAPESAPLRVSVLGIGDAVSTAMCEGIARVGHGVCMLVGEQETSFTGKIARLLKASKTPVISNISVDWRRPPAEVVTVPESEDDFEMVQEAAWARRKTLNIFDPSVDPTRSDETQAPPPPPVILPAPSAVQQSPFKIHNVFPGVRLNVYAILTGRTVPKIVIFRGSTPEGAEIELPIPNDPGAPTAIHALAARKIIQDLEDGQHALCTTLSNPNDTDLLARTVKASIVRLAKTYSISSKHTSFVAVDETTPLLVYTVVREQQLDSAQIVRSGFRNRAAPPPPMAARAPPPPPPPGRSAAPPDLSAYNYSAISSLVLTADRSALPQTHVSLNAMGGAPPPPPAPSPLVAPVRRARTIVASRFLDLEAECCDEVMEGDSESDEEDDEEGGAIAKDQSDPVEALARLQSFDGCFSVEVFTFVGLKETDVRALFPTRAADVVVVTVLAMAFLSTKLGVEVERDSWEGIYEKAKECGGCAGRHGREGVGGVAGG